MGVGFLELIGVAEPALESTDAYATLESLVPPPTADDTSTLSTGAIAAAVNGALSRSATEDGEFVPPSAPAIPRPSTMRPLVDGRWWVLGVVAVLVILAVGARAPTSSRDQLRPTPRCSPPATEPRSSR